MFLKDMQLFLDACEMKGLSAKTIGSYEQTLRLFMQHLDKNGIERTEDVSHLTIQEYVKELRSRGKYTTTLNEQSGNYPELRSDYGKDISNTTINNYLRNMRVFFNWCVEEDILRRSPIRRGDFIKAERKPLEFVSDEDFKRMLRAMDNSKFSEYRDSVLIRLLLDTGMRIGECLAIKPEDVNIEKRCIFLPADNTKGKRCRYVFFSDKMAGTIRQWSKYKDRYRNSEYLFCTNEGKPIQVGNFEANVRKYAKRVGLKDIHPHVLRNNFAKRFLMNGGDIYTLSRILGHSSVTVTEQAYLDLTQDDLAELYRKHSPLKNMR